MRLLRTQIGNPRIWSDWKCSGLSSFGNAGCQQTRGGTLVAFVSTPQTFCRICGNELERLALIAQGQKSLFPCWPVLHHLFCYHIPLRVASEEEQKSGKGFNGEELYISLGCHQVSLLVHLHHASVVEQGGMTVRQIHVSKRQVNFGQGRKLRGRPVSIPIYSKEDAQKKKAMALGTTFSLSLTDGS